MISTSSARRCPATSLRVSEAPAAREKQTAAGAFLRQASVRQSRGRIAPPCFVLGTRRGTAARSPASTPRAPPDLPPPVRHPPDKSEYPPTAARDTPETHTSPNLCL